MAMLRAHAFTPFTPVRSFQSGLARTVLPSVVPSRLTATRTQRGALQVVAAEEAKKKRTDSAVKRAQLAVERRLYNRARKSACATRIKKVIKLATSMTSALPKTEADLKPLDVLVSEAYQEIDKAVVKGVLHKNNGARKKARVARYRRQLLMAAGLFKPSPEHPEYQKYMKLFGARAEAAKVAEAAKAEAAKTGETAAKPAPKAAAPAKKPKAVKQ